MSKVVKESSAIGLMYYLLLLVFLAWGVSYGVWDGLRTLVCRKFFPAKYRTILERQGAIPWA